MTQVDGSILGNAVLRREDPSLLVGADQYLDDLTLDGAGYVHFVRSEYAHATLNGVDATAALAMPGVIGVYTAADLDIPPFIAFPAFPETLGRPPLAVGKVRYVGDLIAAVVAETREQAVDAAEMVVVDADPLPVVLTAAEALAEGAVQLYDDLGANVCFATAIGEDLDPFEGADTVVECTMNSQRLAGVPMEPNGCAAIPDGDHLTVYMSSQNPVAVRDVLVGTLGLDPEKVRVLAPAVGGGFGPKAGPYPEFLILTKLAQNLGRAVRWHEERSENMVNMVQGRDMMVTAKMGFTNDGKIVGLDCNVLANAGAYATIGGILALFTQTMIQAVYVMPKVKFSATTALTNTPPIGAYRGAGRPEATQVIERVLDMGADALGIDPAEIRRMNFLQPEDFPLTTAGGANYDSGEYEKALDAALEAADYQGLLAEQAARRESGAVKQLGIGVSAYVEVTAPAGLHVEYGAVEIHDDGKVTAKVGTSSHGQGHITSFSMIVSDMLGVPMEDITVLQSDTDHIPRGVGTMGSRSLQTAGSAGESIAFGVAATMPALMILGFDMDLGRVHGLEEAVTIGRAALAPGFIRMPAHGITHHGPWAACLPIQRSIAESAASSRSIAASAGRPDTCRCG